MKSLKQWNCRGFLIQSEQALCQNSSLKAMVPNIEELLKV